MTLTPFQSLLDALIPAADGFEAVLPDDWLQGRTAYGGLSAALCFEAAQRHVGDLPPLRSAQFAFIGPSSGRLSIVPTVLRRGKSTVFIGVDLFGEAGLAVRGLLCFGANRASSLNLENVPPPEMRAPDQCSTYFQLPTAPAFTRHFESRVVAGAQPKSSAKDAHILVWLRHQDHTAPTTMASLLALGDGLPPAAMPLFDDVPISVSTMTWSIDLLVDAIKSESGWWLIETRGETAKDGYSAQNMTIWDEDGVAVATMKQTVALFG
ncbi:acyl-CoA thioesterase [Sulfitobacter sp. EhC04]|uniref:thioesterase family protein n=1 Tax=Sulfitobacter sp. EhC04 TaxID=1849168 RepID=UPI0007F4F646|nr:thioesterase family protein [Sulfitobacter sp. EhC04]OAN75700.1 acyl-CoA thioesterase [Sulfitobacter sp. EhC04]